MLGYLLDFKTRILRNTTSPAGLSQAHPPVAHRRLADGAQAGATAVARVRGRPCSPHDHPRRTYTGKPQRFQHLT